MEAIRVVIVDDHQMVREAWKMLLHDQENIQIIGEYSSGIEALKHVPELDVHIVLMDINMSPVNGFEATRKLLKRVPHIKIIGVSINNHPGYARNIMQLGAKGFVTKNSPREEMIKAIQEVMKGKTYICKEMLQKMNQSK